MTARYCRAQDPVISDRASGRRGLNMDASHQDNAGGGPAPSGAEFSGLDRELMLQVARYLEHANQLAGAAEGRRRRTPLGQVVSDHLGLDAETVPVTQDSFPEHRLADADIALNKLAEDSGGTLIGVQGSDRVHHAFSDLVSSPHHPFEPGPVDYSSRPTGPDSTRQVVTFGIWLLAVDGVPSAVLLRGARPESGRMAAELEVLSPSAGASTALLQRVRALMTEHSVLRGQVLSFAMSDYGATAGATLLPRPEISRDDVVLPPGVMDQITAHVVGIGEQRQALRAAGQHLKRGVLLYGPPGTGKTLTVRHLVSVTPGVTVVLLTGPTIQLVTEAASLARALQPSIVVLEDVDLVAMERGHSPQPLLFEVLDALDGLDGDADVTFLMTTNRVEVLERALVQRPGRVDLAVEIPLPARAERRRLVELYAGELPFSADALDAVAGQSEGTTGSFAKELVRRAVLGAALRDGADPVPTDEDLKSALDELNSAQHTLTRRLLSGSPEPDDAHDDITQYGGGYDFGFVAGGPMPRDMPDNSTVSFVGDDSSQEQWSDQADEGWNDDSRA